MSACESLVHPSGPLPKAPGDYAQAHETLGLRVEDST